MLRKLCFFFLLLTIATCGLSFFLTLPASAAPKSKRKPASAAQKAPTPIHKPPLTQDPVTEEIIRLRATLGSPLNNSSFDVGDKSQNDTSFAETIQRLSQEKKELPTAGNQSPAPFPSSQQQLHDFKAPIAPTLRAASRALDNRANDLEDAQDYSTADRLRALAQQLREEARNVQKTQ